MPLTAGMVGHASTEANVQMMMMMVTPALAAVSPVPFLGVRL